MLLGVHPRAAEPPSLIPAALLPEAARSRQRRRRRRRRPPPGGRPPRPPPRAEVPRLKVLEDKISGLGLPPARTPVQARLRRRPARDARNHDRLIARRLSATFLQRPGGHVLNVPVWLTRRRVVDEAGRGRAESDKEPQRSNTWGPSLGKLAGPGLGFLSAAAEARIEHGQSQRCQVRGFPARRGEGVGGERVQGRVFVGQGLRPFVGQGLRRRGRVPKPPRPRSVARRGAREARRGLLVRRRRPPAPRDGARLPLHHRVGERRGPARVARRALPAVLRHVKKRRTTQRLLHPLPGIRGQDRRFARGVRRLGVRTGRARRQDARADAAGASDAACRFLSLGGAVLRRALEVRGARL
ncbi:hypothetical protein M885DRAFT_203586 [Pelagophyceae sp. CCMP2097]|nr:hypothetical protein M885DRAFT_203586 [Pelagophyceae sp. CCMP2097]